MTREDAAGDEGGPTKERGPGRLYMCATPIGNLADASSRLATVLAAVDVVACEDTRHTRTLLNALGVSGSRLLAHHDHNERNSAAGLVELLEAGKDVAVVTDAGTPGIADPGAVVARAALDAGIQVLAVPGPSSVAAALSVAGTGASRHTFVGFLPRTPRELRALLHDTAHDVVVGLESPARIVATLGVVAETQPERRVVLSRELTKLHEQTSSGTARELAAAAASRPPRGEIVLVLDAIEAAAQAVDSRALELVLALEEEGMRMKTAARVVARHIGVPQRDLYEQSVARRRPAEPE